MLKGPKYDLRERVAHLGPREPLPEIIPLCKKSRIFFGKLADTDGSNMAPNPIQWYFLQISVTFCIWFPKLKVP